MSLSELIQAAAQASGGQAALAKALGVSPNRVTDWKTGVRTCPLHVQAQIANLAGEDAKEWVWSAVCRQMGRATAAVLLALAATLAASVAPGADGASAPFKRRREQRQCSL